MSATKKLDVSLNISTSIMESQADLKTGEFDYCVAKFYEVFKSKLPCLVVVNQGFFSPLTEYTFDKEQMLLLKTTSSQKRVLGKMAGVERRQQTKLISLPVNYKEKLFIMKNGKAEKKTTLDVILKEKSLPCKVAYADSREIIAKDRTMSTRGLTIIELTELFDEVYFLGNCVNYGFKDGSRGSFNEYLKNMLIVSSFLNYNIPCGNMKIAEYDPTAVHSKGKLSLLQPNLYTDYETCTQRATSRNYTELDVLNPSSQDTSGSKSTTKQYTPKTGATDAKTKANMNRASSLEMPLPRDRPLPPLPKKSASPPNVPDIKLKSEPFTLLAETVGLKRPIAPNVVKRNRSEGQILENKFEPGIQYQTVAKEVESRDTKPFEPEPDYDKTSERDKQRVAVGKALPVGTAAEQRGNPPIDVKSMSINDVCECLTHLNLHTYRKAFMDDLIDGDLLMDIDRDTLCTHFGMNPIEALRLVKFAATGRLPK
ncbi:hypothetical protein ACF0H5_022824 [Mactra antiquata]